MCNIDTGYSGGRNEKKEKGEIINEKDHYHIYHACGHCIERFRATV